MEGVNNLNKSIQPYVGGGGGGGVEWVGGID